MQIRHLCFFFHVDSYQRSADKMCATCALKFNWKSPVRAIKVFCFSLDKHHEIIINCRLQVKKCITIKQDNALDSCVSTSQLNRCITLASKVFFA